MQIKAGGWKHTLDIFENPFDNCLTQSQIITSYRLSTGRSRFSWLPWSAGESVCFLRNLNDAQPYSQKHETEEACWYVFLCSGWERSEGNQRISRTQREPRSRGERQLTCIFIPLLLTLFSPLTVTFVSVLVDPGELRQAGRIRRDWRPGTSRTQGERALRV